MPVDIASMLQTAGTGFLGGVLGLGLQDFSNQQQIDQQAKLNNLNYEQAQRLSALNEATSLDYWNKTNYSAQVDQLNKAGLNPALLYAKGGSGGATLGLGGQPGGSQANSSAAAPIAMASEMMNLQLLKAQKDNIEADTANKEAQAQNTVADTQNKPLVGQNIQASTASLTQGIENQKAVQALTQIQTKISQIDFDYAGASFSDRLDLLAQQARQMTGMATQALVQGNVDEETKRTKIDSIRQGLVQQYLQQELTKQDTEYLKAGTQLTDKQKFMLSEQLTLEYMKLSNMKDQTAIQSELANFNTDPMVNASKAIEDLLKVVPNKLIPTPITVTK